MNTWKELNIEHPIEHSRIDVYIWWPDPDNGSWRGERLCNCWFYNGRIMHGQHGMCVDNATHWMYPPVEPPHPVPDDRDVST